MSERAGRGRRDAGRGAEGIDPRRGADGGEERDGYDACAPRTVATRGGSGQGETGKRLVITAKAIPGRDAKRSRKEGGPGPGGAGNA